MRRRYHVLDVFTDTKLAGNPLAVVLDAEGLDGVAMQKIAREFNLAETVFCAPPRDPVNSAALRIFTPATELEFAGHPTIGTAILLGTMQAPDLLSREDVGIVLEQRIGPVACSVRQRRREAAHAHFEVPRLAAPWGDPPAASEVAAALSVEPADIGFGAHRPTRFSAGNPVTFVPVASLDALGRARLSLHDDVKAMFYPYTRVDSDGTPTFRARMLAAGYGVPEDPATGSVAAAFPAALLATGDVGDGEHDCILLQGVEMGRPSRIGVAFSIRGGELASTVIGGSAVLVAQGTLEL